ncbi:MAG: homocysteine S-methyltransferase family protein [Bdellovibrionales bacterium]
MMHMTASFQEVLERDGYILGDGGTGTALGVLWPKPFKLPLWSAPLNLTAQGRNAVRQAHNLYIAVGATQHATNTFRTTPEAFREAGVECTKAVRLAYDATNHAIEALQTAALTSSRPIILGGCIAPLKDCYDPSAVPPDQKLADNHGRQVAWFKQAGINTILFETVNSIREAVRMKEAAETAGVDFTMSWVASPNGNLLSGESIADAVRATDSDRRVAVAINCSPLDHTFNAFNNLQRSGYDGIIGAYPNGPGKPDLNGADWDHGRIVRPDRLLTLSGNIDFINAAVGLRKEGASWVGGCCGTLPGDIRALKTALEHPAFNAAKAEVAAHTHRASPFRGNRCGCSASLSGMVCD